MKKLRNLSSRGRVQLRTHLDSREVHVDPSIEAPAQMNQANSMTINIAHIQETDNMKHEHLSVSPAALRFCQDGNLHISDLD